MNNTDEQLDIIPYTAVQKFRASLMLVCPEPVDLFGTQINITALEIIDPVRFQLLCRQFYILSDVIGSDDKAVEFVKEQFQEYVNDE